MKNLQVSLDDQLHLRLKRIALEKQQTLANLIREAVASLVEQHEIECSPNRSNTGSETTP
jgi:predicted transcriptional regulator